MADRAARVLIADDDPFTRDVLSRFLTARGFEIAPEAVTYLLEMIGLDLASLASVRRCAEDFAARSLTSLRRVQPQLLKRQRPSGPTPW